MVGGALGAADMPFGPHSWETGRAGSSSNTEATMAVRCSRKAIAVCAVLGGLVGAAGAQADVSVLNAGSKVVTSGKTSTLSFNAGATADKVVVQVSSEKSGEAFSVTYNGHVLTQVAGTAVNRCQGIFFLDSPYTGGPADLIVDMSGVTTVNGIAFGVVSVAGTTSGAFAAVSAPTNTVTITPPADGALVVAGYGSQDSGGAATADAPLMQLYGGVGIGSAYGAAGYRTHAVAAAQTYSFSGGERGNEGACAAAFTDDPSAPGTLIQGR